MRLLPLAIALTLSLPALAAAQEGGRRVPPVNIPSHHWVYPLLDRMAADGLLEEEWLPGRRPVGGDVVATALDSAVARAERERPVWVETARAAREWVYAEYGVMDGAAFRFKPVAGARLGDGPVTDPSVAQGGVEALYRPADNVGLWAEPVVELGEDGVAVPTPRLGAAWSPGPFRVSAHYGPHRLGFGASGGIVLHDKAQMPWVEVALDEPTYLPWLLKHLGPFQISVAGSGIPSDSLGSAVGFFAGEFRIHPFPWFTAELSRSAVITWNRNGHAITFRELINSALGTRSGNTDNFDDQKASMAYLFRFRIADLAVNPYLVWAWEDVWEIDQDPGIILGVSLPAVPLADRPMGFRYEYVAFGDAGRIIWPWSKLWDWRNWYRHSNRDRYVNSDGVFFGHPLGGYGTEHWVRVEAPLPEQGLLLGLDLFTRDRIAGTAFQEKDGSTISYSNLLYDELPGRSWGGALRGVFSAAGLQLAGRVGLEVGDADWHRATAALQATWLLP